MQKLVGDHLVSQRQQVALRLEVEAARSLQLPRLLQLRVEGALRRRTLRPLRGPSHVLLELHRLVNVTWRRQTALLEHGVVHVLHVKLRDGAPRLIHGHSCKRADLCVRLQPAQGVLSGGKTEGWHRVYHEDEFFASHSQR